MSACPPNGVWSLQWITDAVSRAIYTIYSIQILITVRWPFYELYQCLPKLYLTVLLVYKFYWKDWVNYDGQIGTGGSSSC